MKICVELKNGNKIITEIKAENFYQFINKELFVKNSEWLVTEDLMIRFEDVSLVHRFKNSVSNKLDVKVSEDKVEELMKVLGNIGKENTY